jgi:hypothetical protein
VHLRSFGANADGRTEARYVRTLGDPKAFAATVSDRADVATRPSATSAARPCEHAARVGHRVQGARGDLGGRDGLEDRCVGRGERRRARQDRQGGHAVPDDADHEKKSADWTLVQAHFSFATD